MKKMLCLVISLVVILSSVSALAEEFTLHSGVKFGMTREEVTAAEKANGFRTQENSSYDTLDVEGFIAGYDNSEIMYSFKDNSMTSVHYHFGQNDDKVFPAVKATLISKYGEPIYEDIDGYIDFSIHGRTVLDTWEEFSGYLKCSVIGFSQWLYPIEGGYVDIMLMDFYIDMMDRDYNVLSYSFVTEEAYTNKVAQIEKATQSKNDDL